MSDTYFCFLETEEDGPEIKLPIVSIDKVKDVGEYFEVSINNTEILITKKLKIITSLTYMFMYVKLTYRYMLSWLLDNYFKTFLKLEIIFRKWLFQRFRNKETIGSNSTKVLEGNILLSLRSLSLQYYNIVNVV